jgi:hypothetical protein
MGKGKNERKRNGQTDGWKKGAEKREKGEKGRGADMFG